MASTKKLSKKEKFFYVVASLLAITGTVFLIFGIIGSHYPGLYEDNWVAASENSWLVNWSHMGYRWWGLILLGVGAIIAVITLAYFAKEGDRDTERAVRRAQRLALESEAKPEPSEEAK